MKVNMPVTDQEIMMEKGTILVTRTDLKGRITYVNDEFVRISGFTRKQLVGSNHNMVRHPDMPPAAFADLWKTIKGCNPWTGMVKNRTASGDYYWVEANVTPVFEKGKLKEFLSVRQAPSQKQISQAEQLYQQVNANQATFEPSKRATLLRSITEMAVWKKALIILFLCLVPDMYLIWQLFSQQSYLLLGTVVGLTLSAILLGVHLIRLVNSTLEATIGNFYALSGGYFRNKVDLQRTDQIGDLNRAFQNMQVKLNADLAQSTEDGMNAVRITQALDQVTGNVMMADAGHNIIYMNHAADGLFQTNEKDFQQDLPNFKAGELLGSNIDVFHKNPSHQRHMLDGLEKTLRAEIVVGGRTLLIIATPVLNEGKRLGTVVEWIDRTEEVHIQDEIAEVVSAVQAGQLDKRLVVEGKQDFFKNLSQGINELTQVIEATFEDIGNVMQSMANGNLTNSITNDYQGVYEECKSDINNTLGKLSEVFAQVRDSADFINNSSEEIASGNNSLSQRAEEQAANLEETASSMEELTSTVQNNADNAQQANQLANTAKQVAEKGGDVVNHAVSAMQEINESSNKIADIIGVIDEIAFQTNLLALNASVEAARAGEQGRGFSVVATEVRNLAQRSATAAKESKDLIQNSLQKVRAGTEFVNETGSSLNEIVQSVKKVGDIVAEIAAASSEQSAGIVQVNQAVSQMDEITQQNAALAEQTSAASVSMSEQSQTMVSLLAFFNVGSQVKSATTKQVEAGLPGANRSSSPDRDVKMTSPEKPEVKKTFATSNSSNDEWEEF